MTEVEFNTAQLAEILIMMESYFKDKTLSPGQSKLLRKAKSMYEQELEWDQDQNEK